VWEAATSINCAPFGSDDLQAAISTAAPGATLSIRGTCTGNFLLTQDVTLQAAAGATLDGGGTGRTLTITGGTDTIRDLTITGGFAVPMTAAASCRCRPRSTWSTRP